mmetsp:Transcript_20563/g.55396  ORF Transcript_20563/g.55396 Transcript_20563/m.55396 type:complete len:436 (+) Transcript_20563:117-1424(+)
MRNARARLALIALTAAYFVTSAGAQRRGHYGRAPSAPPPPSEDYYRVLGVPRTANDRQIKKAYRKLALKHHPDKQVDEKAKEKATERFMKISNAYDTLSDPEKRRVYDQFGEEGVRQKERGGDPAAGGPGGAHFRSGFGGGGFSQDQAFNMFESMFGNRGGRMGGMGGFGAGPPPPPPRPPLEKVTLTVDPETGLGFSVSKTNRISAVKRGGAADRDGRLRVGDQIYEVDGQDVDGRRASGVLAEAARSKRRVSMAVAFEDPEGVAHRVRVDKGTDGLGIKVNANNEVTQIVRGGSAAKHGRLRVGDRILQVNGKSLRGAKLSAFIEPGETSFDFLIQSRVQAKHSAAGGEAQAGGGQRRRAGGGFPRGAAGGFPGGGQGGFPFPGAGSGAGGGGFNMEDFMSGMGGMGGRGGGGARGQRMPNMGGAGMGGFGGI